MISVRLESWDEFWPEAHSLMQMHELELGENNPKMPFQVNDYMFKQMQDMGILHIISGRSEGELVGYCMFYLSPSLSSSCILTASQGPWFVHPNLRSTNLGGRLLRFAIKSLKSHGVKNLYLHYWKDPKGSFKSCFERMGAKPVEVVYSLWIGG